MNPNKNAPEAQGLLGQIQTTFARVTGALGIRT